jgi:hypothetical protein
MQRDLPFPRSLPEFQKLFPADAALFAEAKASGKFIKGLFDNISTLN